MPLTCLITRNLQNKLILHLGRSIFVMERRSGSSLSEGRKPERRSGTSLSWHRYNTSPPSLTECWVSAFGNLFSLEKLH
jgi:hypothetical protein